MWRHNPIAQSAAGFAQRRPVIVFACTFVALYVLLILPWPGLGTIYGGWFRALGGMVFNGQHDARYVHFERSGKPPHPDDTIIQIANLSEANHNSATEYDATIDTIGFGWRQTALLLALTLATPIPSRRRGWALLWGFLAIHAVMLCFLGFHIWVDSAQVSLVSFTPGQQKAMDEITQFFLYLYSAVIPVVIWLFVTFRKNDRLATVGRLFFVSGQDEKAGGDGEEAAAKPGKPARK